jgi:hypothetical protein
VKRLAASLVCCSLTAVLLTAPASAADGCTSVKVEGERLILLKNGVGCRFARHSIRRLAKTKGDEKPEGYKCSSGSKFRTGGYCEKKQNKNRNFSWHPAD